MTYGTLQERNAQHLWLRLLAGAPLHVFSRGSEGAFFIRERGAFVPSSAST